MYYYMNIRPLRTNKKSCDCGLHIYIYVHIVKGKYIGRELDSTGLITISLIPQHDKYDRNPLKTEFILNNIQQKADYPN
jgi:hypothetical protein